MSVVVSSGSPATSTLTIALVEEKDTGLMSVLIILVNFINSITYKILYITLFVPDFK